MDSTSISNADRTLIFEKILKTLEDMTILVKGDEKFQAKNSNFLRRFYRIFNGKIILIFTSVWYPFKFCLGRSKSKNRNLLA